MLTAAQLNEIMPKADAARWLDRLNAAMAAQDINNPMRMAGFLAHVAVESGQLRTLVEEMGYSEARLMEVWPQRFPTIAAAAPFANNPAKLGNFVYADRLGNGPPESGDGFHYRGRGLLQATGRDHYRESGAALNLDLLGHPELLEQPEFASNEAAWWWTKKGLNPVADVGAFKQSTVMINGGLTGYDDRIAFWRRALPALGAKSDGTDTTDMLIHVQRALNRHGAQPLLKEDGNWGPKSEAALDQFRAQAHLSGIGLDNAVLAALEINKAA